MLLLRRTKEAAVHAGKGGCALRGCILWWVMHVIKRGLLHAFGGGGGGSNSQLNSLF
jgi:hypothetical protein